MDFVRGEAAGTRGRSPRRANAAVLAAGAGAVLALSSACTSHSHAAPPPPSLLASSSGPSAATQLAAIAAIARAAQYTGTYSADSSDNPPRASTIKAYRTATSTRLDVSEADGRVVIQVDPTGTYTCNLPNGGTPTCLTLAGPGDPVPANVNPSGQALFTTTLDTLAQGVDLTVSPEAPQTRSKRDPGIVVLRVDRSARRGVARHVLLQCGRRAYPRAVPLERARADCPDDCTRSERLRAPRVPVTDQLRCESRGVQLT